MSTPLSDLVGREAPLEDVADTLRRAVEELRPAGVGAHHITCSDESEFECVDALQRGFTRALLPPLKFGERTAFRSATLGSRYEAGSVALAEQHFATAETAKSFKVMLVKINAHVSRDPRMQYGRMQRYHIPSFYCGALRALLDGARLPAIDELRSTFGEGGVDRVRQIKEQVDEPLRPLIAAIVNAGLQARKAAREIREGEPATPTYFLVVSCVTLNREDRDSELVCGLHRIDRRGDMTESYEGLGDDPTAVRIAHDSGRIRGTIQTG